MNRSYASQNNGNGGGHHHKRGHSRMRSRGGKAPSKSQVYDSHGPDMRIRGTAYQVLEKYTSLAKDAQSAGHLVLAENYYQHAEHYQRIIQQFVQEEAAQKAAQEEAQKEKAAEQAQTNQEKDTLKEDDSFLKAS